MIFIVVKFSNEWLTLVEDFTKGTRRTAMAWMPQVIATTPEIINMEVPVDGWSPMAELTPA